MKRDVTFENGKAVVRPKPEDAIARLKQFDLRERVANGVRWTDQQRDVVLLALLQHHGLI